MEYDVSIIIACYNEEPLLEQSVKELRQVMDQTRYSYELIFVDDCSKDKTREIIKRIVLGQQNMRFLFHEKNKGRGGTVKDGIKMASGRIVGFLDIDLEVHARYIPSMIQAIINGYDVVTGYRFYKVDLNPVSFLRHVLSIGYRKIMKQALKLPLNDTETGYKFFNREKILPVLEKTMNQGWFWDTEIMALAYYAGLKIIEIPCLFIRRTDKVSSVKIFKDSFDYLIALRSFKKEMFVKDHLSYIYRHPFIYQLAMRLLYGKNFYSRYKAIAEIIPEDSTVIDVCCGDCYLYRNYLKRKNINYLGLDINPIFVNKAKEKGINARVFDLHRDELPTAPYIILQASLYQFIPEHKKIIEKLLYSASKNLIIAEPIRNLSDSKCKLISYFAKKAANPGTGDMEKRFNEKSLTEVFYQYGKQLKTRFKIDGGREMIGIFEIKSKI